MSEAVKELITEIYNNMTSANYAYENPRASGLEDYITKDMHTMLLDLTLEDYIVCVAAMDRLLELSGDELTRKNLNEILEGIKS